MDFPAIRVEQWLEEWSDFAYSDEHLQRKPEPFFYLCSLPASLIVRLSSIPRRGEPDEAGKRVAIGPRKDDPNVQRRHTAERSAEIRRYVQGGYPWAALGVRDSQKYLESRKPGLLPTAIIANVLGDNAERLGRSLDQADQIRFVSKKGGIHELVVPDSFDDPNYTPNGLFPVNIIDGQHRLMAFSNGSDERVQGSLIPDEGMELPVVFFPNLDVSWEAYLFWTINIRPKRISPSLAFDLYPLLRTQEWLQPIQGPRAYRESRAQEMTEALWSHAQSPWLGRISMLASEREKVSQASFVLSLMESFFRGADSTRRRPGGLFAAPLSKQDDDLLGWTRGQQAAFLIRLWSEVSTSVSETKADWAEYLRKKPDDETPTPSLDESGDLAMVGQYSLLGREMGVRGGY
jgi:DGQHR domain-containing protein